MRRPRPAARLLPSPPGGTEGPDARATLRIRSHLAPLLAVLLVAASTGAARAQASCLDPAQEGVRYSLGLDAERDATGTDVSVAFTLLSAGEAKEVAILLFADGIQVLGPGPVRSAPCDEALRSKLRLPRPEGTPLDLHATVHTGPSIPEAVARMDPDDPNERVAVQPAYDAEDVNSLAYGAPRDPVPGTWTDASQRAVAPHADAYLYDGDPQQPVHLRVLEPGVSRWSFHVWFGETLRRDGTFGITCMVDDEQIDAFDDRPLWFGTLAYGEAAMIPARTPSLSPGWHQVRCLALDDLFAGRDRGVAWPYVIRSTFVYRRP